MLLYAFCCFRNRFVLVRLRCCDSNVSDVDIAPADDDDDDDDDADNVPPHPKRPGKATTMALAGFIV